MSNASEPAEFRLPPSPTVSGPAEFRLPPSPADLGQARWIPKGQAVNVAGVAVPDGLIYVGASRSGGGHGNPSLIQPHLNVATSGNFAVRRTSYWPSYAELEPMARRAYLNWLVTGRRHPDCDIGYVFLFFYGLEHRVIVDGYAQSTPPEWQSIRDEVTELVVVYGNGAPSFQSYAERLLEWMGGVSVPDRMYESGLPPIVRGYTLPWALKIALGQAARDCAALPGSLALAWVRYNPTVFLRTPAVRCDAEFDLLFLTRYAERWGHGLVLRKTKKNLTTVYHPASAGLQGRPELTRDMGDLPDVADDSAAMSKLQDLATECTTELDAYSRAVGKGPQLRGTPAGWSLLPYAVWPSDAQAKAEDLRRRCTGEAGEVMALHELLALLGVPDLTNDRLKAMVGKLATRGIGLEPDVLDGARVPAKGSSVVVFPLLTAPEDSRDGAEYRLATVTLQLAAVAAHADGEFSAEEELHLHKEIEKWSHLTPGQRRRLGAHVRLLKASPVSLSTLKKHLTTVDGTTKERIAMLMVTLAHVDGRVTPATMAVLEKAFGLLGIETQRLFSSVHAVASGGTAASTEAPTSTGAGERKGFRLDAQRIEALQRDTAGVNALLANIFQDDAPEPAKTPVAEAPAPGSARLMGLDSAHSAMARQLLTRLEWTRAELLAVASGFTLMLDGALETINDAAFDLYDLPLTEGEDPVEVIVDVAEKLKA